MTDCFRVSFSASVPGKKLVSVFSSLPRILVLMTDDTSSLIRDALALNADQRALIANTLFKSLNDADEANEVDAAWRGEATRRLEQVRSDAVELVDADAHYAKLLSSLPE